MAAASIGKADGPGTIRMEPQRDSLIGKIRQMLVDALGSEESFSTSPEHSFSRTPIIHIHGAEKKIEMIVGLLLVHIPAIKPPPLTVQIVDIEQSLDDCVPHKGTCIVLKPAKNSKKLRELVRNTHAREASSPSILIFSTDRFLKEKYESTKRCIAFTIDADSFLYPLTACVEKWLYRQYTNEQIDRAAQIEQHRCPVVVFKGNKKAGENTKSAIAAAIETLLTRLFIFSSDEIGELIPPSEEEGLWTKDLIPKHCPGTCQAAPFKGKYDNGNKKTLEELFSLANDEENKPHIVILARKDPIPNTLREYISYIVYLDGSRRKRAPNSPPDQKSS